MASITPSTPSTSSTSSTTDTGILSPLRRRFSRFLFRPRHHPQPHLGPLAIFPPEIILTILAHLDKPSAISFALTCRTFHRFYFPTENPLELPPPEKEELLLRLEKDTAHLFFCHFCVKLHRWRRSWFPCLLSSTHPRFEYAKEDSCRSKCNISYIPYPCVPYVLARVVMNRHFYGPAHGVPARKLRASMRWHYRYVTYSEECDVRIIDDQMMLSMTYKMRPRGSPENVRKQVDEIYAKLCPHIYFHKTTLEPRPPELDLNSDAAPDYFAPCRQSVRSCWVCMTDYCIDIERRRRGWHIEVRTYHQVGPVRSPFDWRWTSMVLYPGIDTRNMLSRSKHLPEHRPGIVRHLWSKADETVWEPRGQWMAP